MHRLHPRLFALVAAALFVLPSLAQQRPLNTGRVVLVLPFENRSGNPALSWIGDSFPDTLDARLNSSGFLTISRDDRLYALDHLGYPLDLRPTRATTIRIAQTLDASFVIVGSFNVTANRISVQAQVLDVNNLRMSSPLEDSADLNRLFDVQNAIAWKTARQIDPGFSVSEQTFLAAPGQVKLSAFENYIRGITATTPQERIKRLQTSVAEAPAYTAALLALGKAQYAERQFDSAAATLQKIPRNDRLALEASFYLGLARFNTARYADAEAAFAFLASRLPLPEVVNNQAVASSRQNHDATPLFQRAVASDPNDADFHYNLAVSLLRRGDFAQAQQQVDQSLKLRPNDREAAELKSFITQGRHLSPIPAATPATSTSTPSSRPAAAPATNVSSRPPTPSTNVSSRAGAPAPATNVSSRAERSAAEGPAVQPATTSSATPKPATTPAPIEPIERIRRTYSEASFRQAAFQLDQLRALRLSTLPPDKQAAEYLQLGHDYLAQGLIPEAEQQFQSALAAAPGSAQGSAATALTAAQAAAHAGLAQIREQSGNPTEARTEAQTSLKLKPTAEAWLVLARLDLRDNNTAASAANVANALKLDPANPAAQGMKQALATRGQSLP